MKHLFRGFYHLSEEAQLGPKKSFMAEWSFGCNGGDGADNDKIDERGGEESEEVEDEADKEGQR